MTMNVLRSPLAFARAFFLAIVLSASAIADANTGDCLGVYVGRITVQKNGSLKCVVFLSDPADTSGSSCTFFTGWTEDDKKAALALLLTARLNQLRFDVTTTAAGGCGITGAPQDLSQIVLASP